MLVPTSAHRSPTLAAAAAPDYAELATLRADVRDDVRRWLAALGSVMPPIGPALDRVAREMGVSPRTSRRKYDAVRLHGWRGLIDGSREPSAKRSDLHPLTIQHWQKLVALNQRKALPAYRALCRAFFLGEMIPGLPDDCPRDRLPRGWSKASFMRQLPTKFELAAMRQGRSAARALGPFVYTTRRGLWVGSHYVFDDLVHDHFVNVLDTAKTGRPLEFHALDLASACKFAWGIRVRTENEITGRMEGLREENMRALLASVLAQHGYHAERGTTMVVEHGTAAIREDLERILFDLTKGRIQVSRSGIEGDPAHVGQYAGRGKGNFRFKAALESLGNLIHNELAFLPAQTGMDVDRRPEEAHGLLRHNDALLEAFVGLQQERPDLAALLRFPVLSSTQFTEIALTVYHRINCRTQHALEGWEMNVRPDERDLMRVRRMSPMEVWQRDRGALTRFRAEQVALVLYTDAAQERTVRGGEIVFRDAEIEAGELLWDASRFRDGEKFAGVVNPFSPDQLYLFDAHGRFAGVAPRIHRVCRADDEAIRREMGRVSKTLNDRLAPVRALGREITEQRIADARHNAEVLARASAAQASLPERQAARVGTAMIRAAEAACVAPQRPDEAPITPEEEFRVTPIEVPTQVEAEEEFRVTP